MRVIARGTLLDYLRNRVDPRSRAAVKGMLDAWYAEISRASWRNSAELKQQFRSASILSSERVVFNIKGNDFRLIVSISYSAQVVLIKWIGTHREYDRINALEVNYDPDRYRHSTDSQ